MKSRNPDANANTELSGIVVHNFARPSESRTITVNTPTRTFTWPLVQRKVSWWRRVLRFLHAR